VARCAVGAVLIFSTLAVPAAAQTVGVRAGVSIDPEQFYFGGHLALVEDERRRVSLPTTTGYDLIESRSESVTQRVLLQARCTVRSSELSL